MRRRQSGFTVLELIVAMGIGLIVTVGALVMTADLQKNYHRHIGELGANQRLRETLELLAQDVRNAGVGVGYDPNGVFGGFLTGGFSTAGGASFSANERSMATLDGAVLTDDLGIRRAEGERRTILFLESGAGVICAGQTFTANELVIVTARNGRAARTIRILGATPGACQRGSCTNGCQLVSWAFDPTYAADSSSNVRSFAAGDLYQKYETVVWFVATDNTGFPALRRASGDILDTCSSVSEACGAEVAEGVEFLQFAVFRLDTLTHQWVQVQHDQPIQTLERLRIDLELVVRARSDPGVGRAHVVRSELSPGLCVPEHCGSDQTDRVPRIALRTSVEVRNAGRLQIR